LMYFFSS